MINLYRKLFLFFILSGFLLVSAPAFSQATFSGGVSPDMCVGNTSYVTIPNITITETNILDFSIDASPGTITISPSTASRFEFQPGVGSINFTGAGSGTVTALLTITASELIIDLSESDALNETGINSIILSGIQVRAINTAVSLQLENIGGVGLFTINGFVPGNAISSSLLESFGSPTVAAAGTNLTGGSAVCGSSVSLAANTPAVGDGQWSFVSNPDALGVIADLFDPTSSFSGTPGQTYELLWTISSGPCTPSTDNVLIQFDPTLSAAAAGSDQDVCGTVTSLTATAPVSGIGTWSFVSNPDGLGAISNVNSATSLFSGAAGSTYILRWTITGGSCGALQDEVTIEFIAPPTTAQAGPNQSLCETITFTLAANAPTIGTGAWTVIAGTATVTNPLSPTSTVTGIPFGTSATLRWRITNGACPASTSDVVLTNYDAIPDTDAGPLTIEQCNTGTFVMSASAATGVNTGSWSVVSGSASITNINLPSTTVTGVAAGSTVILRWTVSNGGVCTDKWDEISLINYPQTSVADAGSDIDLCNTSTFTLAAVSPTVGTGTWSLISGTASITNPTLNTTQITGVPVGTSATLRWTISNGACGNSTDDVVITNYPTVPDTDAGVTLLEQCNTSTFGMTADPAGINTGTWTIVSGSATITNINSPTTTVTGITAGSSATLRWSVSNGVCPDKTDEITLQNYRLPTPANAGVDIDLCSTSTFNLNGNNPTDGTGQWSLISGTASITNMNLRNTTVTGVPEGTSATLRWTISNGVCTPSTDDVVLYNRAALPAVDAGDATITQCNTSIFEMNASNPAPGVGTWTVVSGTASITNINSPTTTITGIPAGSTAVLRWTVSNGGICSPVFDNISLVNNQLPTAANAGTSPINQCDNATFTVTGNTPMVGSGTWSIVSGTATITTPLSPSTTVTGVTAGTSVTLRWSITNGVCAASTSDIVLSNFSTPPTANAGLPSIIQCNTSTFTMSANSPGSGVGTWTVISGTATVTNTASPTTTVTGVAAGSGAVLRWTISSPSCPSTVDDIILINDQLPSVANAGIDINQGANSTFTLNATAPTVGTGVWSLLAGSATIVSPTSISSSVTGVAPGTSVTLRWTVSNGSCPPSVDDLILTNYATPPVADAGPPNIIQCNTSTFTMVANDAAPATGTWSLQSGTGVITNTTSHTTTVTGVAAGTNVVLRWTISDGVNPSTFDEITLINNLLPSVANAGVDIQQCNNGNFTMAAVSPAIGTGVWTVVIGTATITTSTSATTTITGVPIGTSATLRWTVTNGVCTPNTDDIVLTNFSTPITADAGSPTFIQCNNSTFIMNASPAGSGIGVWTVTSGSANITNANSPTTTITGIGAGATAVLRWTVGNGVCAPTFDEITLTNNQPPTVSNAGLDINQCATDVFTLAGNIPAIGTGVWSIVSGPGTITNTAANNTTVTGVTAGMSTTLRWTITNGVCAGSTDDVVITNRITPPVANADAGLPVTEQCNNGTFTMNANSPAPGVGEWTIVSGTATITNTSSRTTTVTGIAAGTSVTLRWTISNGGVCAPTSDDITLTNDQLPTPSNAGLDINQCATDVFTLAGNIPATGTGVWSIVGGPGAITNTAANNTTVTGVTAGMSTTLRWTITNGVCAGSTDDVVLTNRITPPVANADAGSPVTEQCNNGTFTMSANSPAPGVGEWTIVSGSATIVNTSSRTTTVTNVAAGTSVTLRWTISNGGVCAPTSDDITLTNDQLPTVSNAGLDINQCATDVFTLAGNIPAIGTGVWSIISGPGAITNTAANNTTVTGVTAGMSTTLRWTITNGVCAGSTDDVVLTNRITPPVANAAEGSPVTEQCNNGTFTMSANSPAPGVGEWTIVSGTATITNTSSRTTTVTGIAAGTSVTLRWTISNGGVCAPTSDDITLTNHQPPTVSNAGLDINQCATDVFTLAGNIPAIGTGVWSIISGPGAITNTAANNTTVTGVTAGMSTTLRWTISNGVCAVSTDDVVITNRITPPTADADAGLPVTEQCNNSTFVMSANAPIHGSGLWTIVSGTATITNPISNTTTITGVAAGASVTLRWTISNSGICAPTSDDIVLTNYQLPSLADAGSDIDQCEIDTFTLSGITPAIGSGIWSIVSGPGMITTPTANNSTVTGVTAGMSTIVRWTVSHGVCSPTIDDVVLTNRIAPPIADAYAGSPITEQCNNATFVMSANAAAPGIGQWTIVSGSAVITNASSTTTTITGVAAGTSVTLRWTISNGGVCAPTSDDITLTNYQSPSVADAGSDIDQCANDTFTLSGVVPTIGTGTWTILSGPGTITTPTAFNTTVTGVTAGMSTTLRWTVTHGVCSPNVDDVVLTNRIAPLPADAGLLSITQCNTSTFTMNASSASPGVGVWSLISGSATITNINSGTTTVTGVAAGSSVVLRWTVGNGGICADTFDEITLNNLESPTLANAGVDINQCNISTFTLAGNIPSVGTGQWSIINGVGTLTDASNATSTVTGVAAGTSVTLRWTISNGVCTATMDDVVITNTLAPLVNAGSNVDICQGITFNFSNQSTLASAANYNTLLWESVGTIPTGVLYNSTTLTPTYQPGPGETGLLQFRLTATGMGVCAPVTDVMEIMITPAPVVQAGSDEQICEGTTTLDFATRSISASSAHGSLAWTHTGSGSLSNATLLNPVYTVGPTDVGTTITFTLTVTSGMPTVCSQVFDQFTLKVNPTTVVSIPGGDFSICEPPTIELVGEMEGSAIAGSWSIVSGAGGTLSVSSITVTGSIKTVRATYTRLPSEINTVLTFRLTANDPDDVGPCSTVSADVNVTVDESAKVFAGADMNICEYNPVPLSGSFSGATSSVTWSGGLDAGQFSNINNAVTNYNLVASEISANNLSYIFTLTTNDPVGVCTAVSDNVLVTIIDRLPSADITIIGLNAVYAENDNPVPMIGIPGGGIFTGDAVSGNSFFPNIANITPLTNTVFYSVTDTHGCVSTHAQNVVVNPITELEFFIAEETALPNGKYRICAKQGNVVLIENPDVDIAGIPVGSFEKVEFSSPDIPDPDGNIFYDNSPLVQSFVLKTDNLVAGEYHIIMTYTNDLGAPNSYERIYIVASSPVSVIDNDNICETSQANFVESSYVDEDPLNPTGATITEWQWDFGDGNGSTSQSPVYNYPAGVYNVKLKVNTNEGCSDESTKVINVGSTPEMKFDWTEFCNGNFTEFLDQTVVSVGSIVNYKWTFGDGDEITGAAGANVPVGTNGGRTEGTLSGPKHQYLTAGQQYDVTLEVQTDVGCIETITRTAFILEYEALSPIVGYTEDFEAGSGSWFANRVEKLTPTDTSWVFGTPSGARINTAASGNNAWWTGKNPDAGIDFGMGRGTEATYYNNEKSAVIGPCHDISLIKRPMISIDYWSDGELGSDGAALQYSVNGGIVWETIGEDTGNGLNWYNGRALTGNPGGQTIGQFGWTGEQTEGWKTARYNLDQIPKASRTKVIFRIAFGSNNDNTSRELPLNGFAFDNIYIGEKRRTVMVEYFTNAGINQAVNNHFDEIYDEQITLLSKDSSDFFKIQYHIQTSTFDPINFENVNDPRERARLYGVRNPPAAIMDGILGDYYGTRFDGNHSKITVQEIDRRALEDPLFDIEITNMVADDEYTDSLKFRVIFKYIHPTQALSNPVTYQVALLEDSVGGLGTNRNVLRKLLLGTEGKTVSFPWTQGSTDYVDIKTSIDIPIGTDNKRLYLVAFVQDKKIDDTKIIHQAIIQRAPIRSEKLITGVEDDPILAQAKDINIYPNPASQVINFATQQILTREYEWSIIDQRGVTVLSGKLERDLTIPQQVELANIADGVYIVAIKQNNRPLVYRKIAVLKRGR